MVLKKSQKAALLEWIADGLKTDEINNRAATFKPPFSVTRQHVDYYRKTRKLDMLAILSVSENNALTTGLSLKEERVKKLQQLAALMEKDLLGGFLWLDQVKSIGSGPMSTIVDYEEFNKGEIEAYRGVLDDIAREVGDRTKNIRIETWQDKVIDALRQGKLKPELVRQRWGDELASQFFRQAGVNVESAR